MKVFHENVHRLAKISRFGSREELSKFVFDKPKYLANAAGKEQDISISRSRAVADALGVSLDVLTRPGAGLTSEAPSLELFIAIHQASGGQLDAFEGLLHHCMVIHAPKENETKSRFHHIGDICLAVRLLKNGKADLPRAVESWEDRKLDQKLMLEYSAALSGRPMTTTEEFRHEIEVAPYYVSVEYIRLLLGLHDKAGNDYVLIYCIELVSPTMFSATI